MSKKVELLRRTPYGAPGDIVEVDDEIFNAYDRETMVETDKTLTGTPDHTLPADTVDRVDEGETPTSEKKAETPAETTSVDEGETSKTVVEAPKKKKLFGLV